MDELRQHFEEKGRAEAIRNLDRALGDAETRIAMAPQRGLMAPRPYPDLAKSGRLWLKAGRYWIAYTFPPPMILGVFYEAADLPRRV